MIFSIEQCRTILSNHHRFNIHRGYSNLVRQRIDVVFPQPSLMKLNDAQYITSSYVALGLEIPVSFFSSTNCASSQKPVRASYSEFNDSRNQRRLDDLRAWKIDRPRDYRNGEHANVRRARPNCGFRNVCLYPYLISPRAFTHTLTLDTLSLSLSLSFLLLYFFAYKTYHILYFPFAP